MFRARIGNDTVSDDFYLFSFHRRLSAPSPYLCYMPRSTSTSPQSPLVHHVSLYISKRVSNNNRITYLTWVSPIALVSSMPCCDFFSFSIASSPLKLTFYFIMDYMSQCIIIPFSSLAPSRLVSYCLFLSLFLLSSVLLW